MPPGYRVLMGAESSHEEPSPVPYIRLYRRPGMLEMFGKRSKYARHSETENSSKTYGRSAVWWWTRYWFLIERQPASANRASFDVYRTPAYHYAQFPKHHVHFYMVVVNGIRWNNPLLCCPTVGLLCGSSQQGKNVIRHFILLEFI